MNQALKTYIEAWLLKAEHDLLSAQRLLEIEPMILDNACFHCQQAIEKCLKGFLHYHSKDVIKTHDIDFLLGECSAIDPIFNTIDSLNINDYAVHARYPDTSLMPEIEEAKSYYRLALHIKSLVIERIVFT